MAKYVGFKTGKIHKEYIYSEYYCGGCGHPVTDHDSYCPECGGAFRKCDSDDYISKKETNNMNKIIEWLYDHPGVNVLFYRGLVSSFVEIEVDNGYECSDDGGRIKHTVSKMISLKTPKIEDEIMNILNNSDAKLRSLKMND